MSATQEKAQAVGYRLEFRAGDYCHYTPSDFARETYADRARICGLFAAPQPGCSPEPAAYLGRYWHEARHYANGGARIDPGAQALYLGPVMHSPTAAHAGGASLH